MANILDLSQTSLDDLNQKKEEKVIKANTSLGYIDGYESLASEKNKAINVPIRDDELISKIGEEFRYEIDREKRNEAPFLEDPLYLDFNLLFIKDSPLFKTNIGVDKSNTALKFLKQYKSIPEINRRITLHEKFIEIFNQIFDFDRENNTKHYKNYLIESITGLENMNKKIFNPDNDIISITLTENVSMSMLYLAELYNNLIYDYDGVREIIPDNCLRFNMYVKLKDVRLFKGFDPETKEHKIDDKQSHIIYVLNDCILDFSDSLNTTGAMDINGFNVGVPDGISKLSFNIRYKSVKRVINPYKIKNGLYMDSKNLFSTEDNYNRDYGSIYNELKNEEEYKATVTNDKLRNLDNKSTLGNVIEKSGIVKRVVDIAKKEVIKAKDDLIRKFKELRGELLNDILYEIREKIDIPPKIYPDNVYDEDFHKLTLENFAKALASNIYTEVEDAARESVSDLFGKFGL